MTDAATDAPAAPARRHAEAFSLRGQHALITGGGSGLGLAIAEAMAAAGAAVTLVGRREDALRAAAERIGDAASIAPCDITAAASVRPMLDRAAGERGPIACLVNNAGIHLKKTMLEATEEEFERVLATHVTAAVRLTRGVLPGMLERGSGSILFTASMASLIGIPLVTAYSAAKSAHLGLVRSLAAEVSSRGVRVNAIAPGWIETPMLRGAIAGDEERGRKILSRTPMGRFGRPEEIGRAAVFLASPAASFITGVCLPVDGGGSIGF